MLSLNKREADLPWSLILSWTRVSLAAAAALSELLLPPRSVPLLGGLAGFFVFSLVVAGRRRTQAGALGLLTLFIDALIFLVLANHGIRPPWLPAVFYLLLLTEVVMLYSPQEVLVVGAICLLFCALARIPLFTTVLVGAVLAAVFSFRKRRLRVAIDELIRKHSMEQQRAARAAEAERQKIASDFHDGPLQSYISLQMRLEILRKLLERDLEAGMGELGQLQALAQSQVHELRSFIRGLRGPMDVDAANMLVSARRVAEDFEKASGISVTFLGSETPPNLPPETSGAILQMLREALNNVQKHAGATRVAVAMERNGRHLEVSVDDNGNGFNFSGTYNLDELDLLRLGPGSIRKRARAINAELILESRPGRGSGLKWKVPLS